MLTLSQANALVEILDNARADGFECEPARVATFPDVPSEYADQYGDGTVLFVGRTPTADDPLADCDCGRPHVEYMIVRADGAISPTLVSGTLMEAIMGLPVEWDEARAMIADDIPDEWSVR